MKIPAKIVSDNELHVVSELSKGAFLALKVPRAREPEFFQVQKYKIYVRNNCLHILAKFQENLMDRGRVMGQNVPFLTILGHFDPFCTPWGP